MESSCAHPFADALDMDGVRDALLALPHPFKREDVHRVVSRLRVSAKDLERWQNWSDERHTRTRYYQGERFEMLVLCWKPGQWSPIHDHANSICTMYVLQGSAVTTMYRVDDVVGPNGKKRLVEDATAVLGPTNVTTVFGGDIHRVGNPAASGTGLVTIHVYLPPIPEMLVWDEGDAEPRVVRAITLDPKPVPPGVHA
jgi:cysteine dioxygenase